MCDYLDPELDLLGNDFEGDDEGGTQHALRTAPVFTGDAFDLLGPGIMPQRALYGRVISQHAPHFPTKPLSPKIYINTNAPFSALVCGVQGSGKSHSTSVILESCLMSHERLGTLPEPLSALVFHFDTAAGGGLVQPCEAAYLAALDKDRGGDAIPPLVTVLVFPTNLHAMRKVYAGLPGVKVEPLHFAPEDISGERLLTMMKVDESIQMPLYMESIMALLRSMEGNFDYRQFRGELDKQKFNSSQKAMLRLRLSLLDSCLLGGNSANRVSSHFSKGQLTIIDLSSPYMDGSSACGFFDLILGLFVEAEVNASGKLVVLDEAHKSCTLFKPFPKKVVSLKTGEAVLFAPNGLGRRDDEEADTSTSLASVAAIGEGHLIVRSRQRVTRDGGHSLLAVRNPETTTRLGRVARDPTNEDTRADSDVAGDTKVKIGPTDAAAGTSNTAWNPGWVPWTAENSAGLGTPPGSVAPASSNATFAAALFEADASNINPPIQTRPQAAVSSRGLPSEGPTMKALWKYFRRHQPLVYGDKLKKINSAITEAKALEIIVSRYFPMPTNPEKMKERLALVPGARYVFE
ncbi:hypothetical protein EW026_g4117 [Hermanssonia centrifuga]|uniref:Uncharacterized protein n=1 Tax=Hermanssonia centrifuga TaxID=98765 RepID=A0A4S4KI64_9APHY|nr:hypothetical protein EW026_g4117 [Hermanssonia centrifuga]